ncbi:MAG: hypothetical protein A2Z25_14620 [Planctomycetes bacterium RBG_16_55_9]|nr:MAG: hypothetical protein A2Z25_14620 [Planctomycetes bacterium RBG_16_55_9]
MKNWLTQTSTIVGLLMVAATGLQLYQTGGDWITVTLGVISGLALLIRDGAVGGPKTMLIACLALSELGTMACGASVDDLPISDAQKIEIAVQAGCAAAASSGCLEDEDVQQIIGELYTSDQCVEAVNKAIAEELVTINVALMTARVLTCDKFSDALGNLKLPE